MKHSVVRAACPGLAAGLLLLVCFLTPLQAGAICSNFLAIDGVLYTRSQLSDEAALGRPLTDEDLGPEYRRVEQNIASVVEQPRGDGSLDAAACGPTDNFSSDLPIGTPLYEVRGYDPTFRLAARLSDDAIVLFEADYDPSARTGGELFDIDGRVAAVLLIDRESRPHAQLEDAETVSRLVELMLSAPISDGNLRSHERPLTVIYRLVDGTVAIDRWYLDTGELGSGIQAPLGYSDVLRSALEIGGTLVDITPVP